MSDHNRSYPDSNALLPHSGQMNLLDELVEHSPDDTTCRFTVETNHIFARDDQVPAWFGIEFMGQCAFYHYQLNCYEKGNDLVNALFLGGREISVHQSHLQPNVSYRVYARDFGLNDRFFAAKTKIYPEDDPSNTILKGRLSALIFDKDEDLISQR